MVPPKAMASEPLALGNLDLLALVQSLCPPAPPLSVAEAIERKDEFKAYDQRKKESLPIAKMIIRAMNRNQKLKDERAQEEEEEEEGLGERLIRQVLTECLEGVGKVAKTILRASMAILRWTASLVFTVVRGGIAFLVANPWVALAAGIVALGVWGYYYFKSKDKLDEEQGAQALPAPEAKAQPTSEPVAKVASPSSVSSPAPSAKLTTPKQEAQPTVQPKPVQTPVGEAAKPKPSANNSSAKEAATGTKKKTKKPFVVSEAVTNAILNASKVVGVPVTLLTALIGVESGFGANTEATTSSARGIAQFVKGTWAAMLKRYGPTYGVPADADPSNDVYSAIMAAAMIKHEGYPAVAKVVSAPSITDVYLTHFLGAGGGVTFLKGYLNSPDSPASSFVNASAVKANSSVFNKGESPRSTKEVYELFAQRLQAQLNKGANVVAAQEQGKESKPVVAQAPPAPEQKKELLASSSSPPVGSPQTTPGETDIIKQGKHRVKVSV